MDQRTEVIQALFKYDRISNESDKVQGIAQLAADKGYEHLSPLQQNAIMHLLTRACDGVTDPGDNYNNCNTELGEEEYLRALSASGYYEALLCDQCQGLMEGYQAHWQRLEAE